MSSVGSFFSYVNDARSHEPEEAVLTSYVGLSLRDLVSNPLVCSCNKLFAVLLMTLAALSRLSHGMARNVLLVLGQFNDVFKTMWLVKLH